MMAVFGSDRSIQLLTTARLLAADGTFDTCPLPYGQLFVLQVIFSILTKNILARVRGYRYGHKIKLAMKCSKLPTNVLAYVFFNLKKKPY